MGVFSVDEVQYRAHCQSLSIRKLQQEETRALRSRISSGWGIYFGVAATAGTAGAALPLPVIAGVLRDKAKDQLEIIQQELRRQGVAPREPSTRDYLFAFGISYGAQAVGPAAEGLAEFAAESAASSASASAAAAVQGSPPDASGAGPERFEVENVAKEVAKAVPSEAATAAAIHATRKI
ncbi:hypothetical protein CMUS01_10459 [Colletotrichum musicola]|uniref:Uncharacterized protein n=1 Tax=Colletotrichum musicola TaxID=2175873 RepID=A0A8H6K2I3_9PEZI|nr:hypothetical protein CMUS01_10459 [Colletotrichum musicola]